MTFSDTSKLSLSSLNDQQKAAVTAALEPCLVVAGAGTGKTTVLIRRFEYLVKVKKIPPEEIILVTYTRKASAEIKKRIGILFNKDPEFMKNVRVSTFHKFCREILASEGRFFNICFESKAVGYVREAIQRLNFNINSNSECTKLILKVKWFQKVRKNNVNPQDLIKAGRTILLKFSDEQISKKYPFEDFKKIWDEYEKILKETNSLYYDDILYETDELLEDEVVRSKWDEKTKAILFDEFQDIDPIQFRILVKLRKENRNIFCVGDPDQAIYGFRNALPDSFEDFKKHFKDSQTFKLEINYRSTIPILDVANELINKEKNNFSKTLIPNSKDKVGEKVSLFISNDAYTEVEKITNTILELNRKHKVLYKKCAVLFRNWYFGRKVNQILNQKRIPYFSEDLRRLAGREEIRDLMAYLNIAFEDNIYKANKALLRVINKPSRGFGKKFLQTLIEEARELGRPLIRHVVSAEKVSSEQRCEDIYNIIKTIRNIAKNKDMTLRNKMERILEETGLVNFYKKIDRLRVENIYDFLDMAFLQQALVNFEEFKQRLREVTKYSLDKDVVYLTTIHGSKGLEFDYVFVMHLDEGHLPSFFSLKEKDPEDLKIRINEERRLAYVAFTRAKKRLFLSSCTGVAGLSRFVKDIEQLPLKEKNSFNKEKDIFDDDELFDKELEVYSDEDLERSTDLVDNNDED